MNWKLHKVIPYRTDRGRLWKLTLVWEHRETLELKTVHWQGVDLNYIGEVSA